MKFPLRQILEIGLPLLAGPAGASIPSIVSKRNRRLGYRDNPERGHDFAAVGVKQIFEATFNDETVKKVNRIILTWATLLVQEAEQDEQDEQDDLEAAELEDKKKRSREKRATRRKKRKPRKGSR